ncbi:uncharacterized protein BDW43DRAFT_316796 [Aspergillus alliaceus]|uniref:uncharacterized protein n=1 Tax=Petromyces alliaceus TaxID=209559 RepID=UPI0012A772FA|nr:uncharacterized protein BDW43DRAFT_316796 [Aspergillus alliaceus]KAB8227492.1 hypothetical protein BDW43DRAFT_316796 [Aspergillus alliaceus]
MPTIPVFLWILTTLLQIGWARFPNTLCSTIGGHYCTHGSLQSPTIVSCPSPTRVELRSCNIEHASSDPLLANDHTNPSKLSHILPQGYETWALSGDAICAFNGTGYIWRRVTVPVPETVICNNISESLGLVDEVLDEGMGLGSGSIHEITSSPRPSRSTSLSLSHSVAHSSSLRRSGTMSPMPTVAPVIEIGETCGRLDEGFVMAVGFCGRFIVL